jgi:very-short-patch-repair endonuclease
MKTETERARAMRKALTPPDARMWAALKTLGSQGYHFRRQVPFRGYVLDFACHGHRLVIEVDGSSHAERGDHDARRDRILAKEGYRTLRFTNQAVRDDFHHVFEAIMTVLASSIPTRPALRFGVPPHKGEGERS